MVIEIKGLTKCYPPATYALKNLSLSIARGEIFGIIGMSGAGKSTLIRALTRLEIPTEGEVVLEGEEISSLSGNALRAARKKMGLVFQHFNLFSSRTALENILYPMEIAHQRDSARALELLQLVGLGGKSASYPAQLSGGEKQRVGIARALANNPKVLFCDEATSALDPLTTRSILDLLVELNQKLGLTIVLITHEMEVIKRICTRVAVLEQGEIVEEGRVADLFAHPSHPTTKRFLQNLVHDLPDAFLPRREGKELLRLGFKGRGAEQPVISEMVKRFDIDVNILLGGIDHLRDTVIGNLIIELSGSSEERIKARLFLEEKGVVCESL